MIHMGGQYGITAEDISNLKRGIALRLVIGDGEHTLVYVNGSRSGAARKTGSGSPGTSNPNKSHRYSDEERRRVLSDAKKIGPAAAARKHGVAQSSIRLWSNK